MHRVDFPPKPISAQCSAIRDCRVVSEFVMKFDRKYEIEQLKRSSYMKQNGWHFWKSIFHAKLTLPIINFKSKESLNC